MDSSGLPGRNALGGCWAHNSDVYREPAYRWWLAGGNIVDLCAECTVKWRADPSGLDGPPLRISDIEPARTTILMSDPDDQTKSLVLGYSDEKLHLRFPDGGPAFNC